MNDQLTERIEEYLQLETNYAIILNGDYGIGKTYYIKNELFPYPTIEEQIEISKYIENITLKISNAVSLKAQEIEKLKEYKIIELD